MANYLSDRTGANIDAQLDKADTLLTPASGETLFHTGNIIGFDYESLGDSAPTGLTDVKYLLTGGAITSSLSNTALRNHFTFLNPNGTVGTIATLGSATSYNTSSDPRLKEFSSAPSDESINTEFNKIFSCFRTFNWKSDMSGDLVWGFDAHACIDLGTNIGSEGEGPRDVELGYIYETIPAVTEQKVVLDSKGKPTSKIETIVIKAEINKKVTPAGVDQSKAVPVLLAMIELQKREILAITARLDAANI